MVTKLDNIKILCVDDEKNVLKALQRTFMDEDFEILTAESGDAGLAVIDENPDILLIMSDYRMPGMNGVDFLKQAYERNPRTIRIVLSGYADTAAVVSAINDGRIYKFIPKPWNDDELLLTIKEAIDVFRLKQTNEQLTEQLMEANDELMQLNEYLEDQVASRTEELEFQIRAMSFAHNVMNALPVPVLGMTQDGLIVLGNKLSEVLFSDKAKSLVGLDSNQVFPENLQKFVPLIVENGHAVKEMSVNGKTFFVKGTKLPPEEDQEGIILMFNPS